MFKKTLLGASLALVSVLASATNYYLVAPVAGKAQSAPAQSAITVALNGYALPEGVLGVTYPGFDLNSLLTVTGDAAYSGTGAAWSVDSGAIPAGLSLSAGGVITGKPTAAGTGSFTLKATYKTKSGAQSYQIVVLNITVGLASAALPAGGVGTPYSVDLKPYVSVAGDPHYGGTGSVQFSLGAGTTLPSGLSLSSGGVISGTPDTENKTGTDFQVLASYKGVDGQQVYTIVVNRAVLQVRGLSLGNGTSCAVTPTGGVKCWGSGGKLGNGASVNSTVPVDVSGISNAVEVAVGSQHACARLATGSMVCWGGNTYGQLGTGTTTGSAVPVQVTGFTSGVTSIAAGGGGTCAVKDGAAYCWGYGVTYRVGNGGTANTVSTPAKVMNTNVVQISTSQTVSCAVTADHALYCWGSASYGELGRGSAVTSAPTPALATVVTGVSRVSVGNYYTCVSLTDQSARCFGVGVKGQLGQGVALSSGTPVTPVGLVAGTVSVIEAGYQNTCAITVDGTLYCWGLGGGVGDGTSTQRNSPVPIAGVANASMVAIDRNYAATGCVMSPAGAQCWGTGASGQLGNGSTASTTAPADVQF